MKRALYPGSFDPITLGHLDVIQRGTQVFDEIIVAVAHNESKQGLFSTEERLEMIRQALGSKKGVTVIQLDGLLVDYARHEGIKIILRGLRAVSDFEFEFQMALANRRLFPQLETLYMTPKEEYSFISSRIVKEIGRLGGDVSQFVPPVVSARLKAKFAAA